MHVESSQKEKEIECLPKLRVDWFGALDGGVVPSVAPAAGHCLKIAPHSRVFRKLGTTHEHKQKLELEDQPEAELVAHGVLHDRFGEALERLD